MKYLNRKQATDWLRDHGGMIVGDDFLAREAVFGTGPLFRYSGRQPLYTVEDLAAWLEDRLSAPVRSPSDAGRGWSQRRRAPIDAPPEPTSAPTRRARPYKRRRQKSAPTEAPADVSAA
jgi:hypothetical protein